MSKNKGDGQIIEGHEYDGIKELDHPLPKWWVNLFYGTIVFAFGYVAYYWFLGGPTHLEELAHNMQKIEARALSLENLKPVQNDEAIDLKALMADKIAMESASKVYIQTCAACHGAKGEGVIGPNLTDNYWIHSKGDLKGILVAIREGFPEKGMPPWKDVVAKKDHAPLAAYVISLQGTKPQNPKAPQGELIQ